MKLYLPEKYDPRLSIRETEEAIKYIRDTFQKEFGKEMNLERISAPLFVTKASGVNDDLNGVERKVSFDMKEIPDETMEVVQSLATEHLYLFLAVTVDFAADTVPGVPLVVNLYLHPSSLDGVG